MDTLEFQEFYEHGRDAGRGNLLGIQPLMRPADYASEEAFYQKLDGCLALAADRGWVGARTVVVFPEYLGTWLVAIGEGPAVLAARTVSAAMRPLVVRHLGPFLRELLRAREPDRATAALFRVKAPAMARAYQSAFARLARRWAVTIAAGSILLPNPQVVDGQVQAGQGALYNAAFLFHPDGRADERVVKKVYPIASEKPFVTCGTVSDLPVFDTPAGRLGILICADSWFPEVYEHMYSLGVELLAVPSASSPGWAWERPWQGYSGWPPAPDVDPADVGRLTERLAWGKYALAGRFSAAGARAGINVFLYANLWDLELNGGRWRLICGADNVEGSSYGPALVNLWL